MFFKASIGHQASDSAIGKLLYNTVKPISFVFCSDLGNKDYNVHILSVSVPHPLLPELS